MNDIFTITEHQVINVGKYRDIDSKTISYEDRELLFDVVFTDNTNNKRFVFENFGGNKIRATSIVGSISLKNGLIIEILPKFAKVNLNEVTIKKYRNTLINMIRVSNEKSFVIAENQNTKKSTEDLPLLNYIIELFSSNLLETLRTGLYSTYEKQIEHTNKIRGNLLVTKTIQNNLIDKSKVYVSHNSHTSDNHLMRVFKTLTTMLINDSNLSYNAKQNFYEIHSILDNISIINLSEKDFTNISFNRLNDKFESLFRQAEYIYKKYMPFVSTVNSSPFWSILFDMDFLFEKFLSYLLNKSNLNVIEQAQINSYSNNDHNVYIKPDFIINNNRFSCVIDAKWKLIDNRKTLYGLNSQNFWQIHSYMNLVDRKNEINGYFIVPKNSDYIDEIISFKSTNENKKNIKIIAIDFSLEFKDIISNYKFDFVDDELLIKYEHPIVLDEIRIFTKKFNLKNIVSNFNQLVIIGNDNAIVFYIEDDCFKYTSTLNFDSNDYKNSITNTIENFLKTNNLKTLFVSSKDYIDSLDKKFDLDNDFRFKNISINTYFNMFDKRLLNRKDFYFALNFYDSYNKEYVNEFKNDSTLNTLIDQFYLRKNKIQIFKQIRNRRSTVKKNYKKTSNPILIKEENISIIENDLLNTILNSENYEELKKIINENKHKDEVLIILFYRNYSNYELKMDIQDHILENANSLLVKYIFNSKINELVDSFKKTIREINSKKINWLYGFSLLNSNYMFKIKEIIASYTSSEHILEILSSDENEPKILNGVARNFYANTKLLDKITNITIDKNYTHIAHSLIKRKDISFDSFKNILLHFNLSTLYTSAKELTYFDDQCKNFINTEVIEPNIKTFNYEEFSYDEKLDFVIEAKFDRYSNDLIKLFCYEEDIDILVELIADKHNTLKLRFLVLVYILNFRNRTFKEEELFDAIRSRENKVLDEIVSLSENDGVRGVSDYIEANFKKIDKEILMGYAMSNRAEVHSIRAKICELTIDLEILDELSKIKDDEAVLRRIIMRPRYSDELKELIRGYNTPYSLVILDRIARYSEYYRKDDKYCLIYLLARDFNTSIATKRFIFEEYAVNNSDTTLANIIYDNIVNAKNKELNELAMDIYEFLNKNNTNLYNKIDLGII